ncbi:S8 family serine peptidase [Pseudomonas corrugata]|uniref:S8 family serine peptidase n=1 Tax=Pseudomonas corrugata TaxID=47879 RepID=UPI003D81BF4B
MAEVLKQADLDYAQSLLGSNGPAAMYDYLAARGYKYAELANGVAKGNSLAGEAAIGYMKETASDQGRPIAEAEVDAIRRDMAQNYIDSLKFQAKNSGGLVTREISHDEAWEFHKDVFLKHGLTVDAWTLNTPFLMMSEDMRAAFWQDTLAAAGDPLAEAKLSYLTMMFMEVKLLTPGSSQSAAVWMEKVTNLEVADFVFSQAWDFAVGGVSDVFSWADSTVDYINSLAGSVRNDFSLRFDSEAGLNYKSPTDHDEYINQVSQGLIASGGGWKLGFDSNKLNLNQYQGNWINNTFAAAATQILADGYRPGNVNTVKEVFDFSLRNSSQGLSYGSTLGALLNSGDARARVTLPTDPLVLDLNGDGVRLTDYLTSPVFFDADNDGGSLEETGWVSPEDGIVVVDTNANGKIDNISETLSEYFGGTAGANGEAGQKRFANGFAALASLDSNSDGVFDKQDAAWSNVKVWVDANHDGKSWNDLNGNGAIDAGETSELKSLADLGITQINLSNQVQSGEVRDGNEVLARGTFVQNGISKEAIAANFLANPNGHVFTASGTGTVVSTQGSGEVSAVKGYVSSSTMGETIDVAQKGVNNATGGSGNDVLQGDAQTNWLAGGQGSDTFNGGAGDDVLLIDGDDLAANIHGGDGTDIVQVLGDKGVYLSLAEASVEIAQGGRGNDVFLGGGNSTVYMRGGDGDDVLVGGSANDALSGENGNDTILGGAGNDVLRGHRGSDQIQGGSGDDLIDGGQDDDSLNGGLGNDILTGGAGDDKVDGGDGLDVIELSGDFSEYRISRTAEGVWISDTVAGRDGTDFLQNVEKANFKNLKLVEIPTATSDGIENPLLVKDVLSKDKSGVGFERTSAHLIGKEQLLQNDIDWQQDALHITGLFDVVGGTAVVTQAGDVLFTPDATFTGIMGFKYTVADAKGNEAGTVVNMGTGESATMRAAVYLKTSDLPDDPLVTDQWYLSQANILPVWKDYTGKGVRIVEIETNSDFGTTKEVLDYRHADLKDNIDQNWLANATPGQMAGEGSGGKFSDHATLVAGVMVAARNGEGSVGVAYDATVAGYWVNKDDFSNMSHMYEYDVVNNSWGSKNHFDLKFSPAELGLLPTAYHQALEEGRDGLGTVIVTAGGNDREKGGNTNYSNVTNSRSSIIVGAINATTDLGALQFGGKPFSSPGASILVSAPGSNVTSTSRLVQNDNGSTFGGDTSVSQGTSFAAPIVSGIVALMLEANPELGYRDVQQILALSARKVADPTTSWQDNGGQNWNGGGMHVSHDYGYGEVDARAAVRLAETWSLQQTFHNEFSLIKPLESGVLNRTITDGQSGGISHSLTMGNANISVEHVEVKVSLTHARPGDLILKLISPSGTESILMSRPGKVPGSAASDRGDSDFDEASTLDYVFDTALLRGESTQGDWTLQVIDTVTGDTGTLNSWSLNVYGKGGTADDQYVYTNEYAKLAASGGRNVLNDTDGGEDTINAAAISSASVIDLSRGEATLAGARLAISNPGQIEHLIGGEFADTLTGNAVDNHLSGGRGDDTLSGGAGVDTLIGGKGSDTLTGGADTDYFVIDKAAGDIDTLTDFVIGTDRIVLSGFDAEVYSTMTITQQGADTRLSLADGQVLLLKNVQSQGLTLSSFVHIPDGVRMSQLEAASGYGFGLNGVATERNLPNLDEGFLYWTNDGGERVFGGTGADTILGGLGDDVLVGESSTAATVGGHDFIDGGEGNDVVRGSAGDDVLRGGAGLDYLGGDAGNDVLYLEGDLAVSDYASTTLLSPNINLSGAATHTGASVAGGAGNDRFVLVEDIQASASQGVMANLIDDFEVANTNEKIDLSQIRAVRGFSDLNFSTVTVDGEQYLRVWLGVMASGTQYLMLKGVGVGQLSAANFIFGQASVQPKVLVSGTDANDLLVGDVGGNTLDGRAGADVMEGRLGDDTYIVDNLGDVVKEVVGGGYDLVKSGVSHVLADEVESLQLQGSAAINGTGNGLSNRLVGNSANNVLDGAGGSDVMIGGLGDDTYVVDDGFDRIVESEGEGTDTVNSSVSFTLGNHLENLSLTGHAAINATGNATNNILRGNTADNRLDGAQGADRMVGGMGNDTYFVDNVGDIVVEDADRGNDKVISTIDYTLTNNVEMLTLSGPALNGSGNALANELIGNELNNRLYGGAGDDFLQGGKGDDRYVFGVGHGQDRINEDLDVGGGTDTIVFEAGIQESDVAVDHSAQGMVLRLNDGQQIISGWTAARGHSVERIEFANGTVWNTAIMSTQANRAPTVSTAVADQRVAEAQHIEQFRTADGKVLLENQVDQLVGAMAAFAPPAPGETSLPQNYQASLNAVIASNWQ